MLAALALALAAATPQMPSPRIGAGSDAGSGAPSLAGPHDASVTAGHPPVDRSKRKNFLRWRA